MNENQLSWVPVMGCQMELEMQKDGILEILATTKMNAASSNFKIDIRQLSNGAKRNA